MTGLIPADWLSSRARLNRLPVINYLMDEFASLHREEARLQFHCLGEAQFNTVLDADGVAILLRNLIDNALKQGESGTTVDVVADSERNEVRVINDGPVVSATELLVLNERFKRGAGNPFVSSESGPYGRLSAQLAVC